MINYTGDRINFGLAVEKARREGLKVSPPHSMPRYHTGGFILGVGNKNCFFIHPHRTNISKLRNKIIPVYSKETYCPLIKMQEYLVMLGLSINKNARIFGSVSIVH